jgi:hypothetical protein
MVAKLPGVDRAKGLRHPEYRVMKVSCFCQKKRMDIEHSTFAINGVPCCSTECYEAALEAQGVGPGNVVMVTVRRRVSVEELVS